MIRVFIRSITEYEERFIKAQENGQAEVLLNRLEEGRRERLSRMTSEKARRECVAAGLLLHEALCTYLEKDPSEASAYEISYTENGKPYLTDPAYAHVHFSLSHSGGRVCCAVGDVPLGIDIQKVRKTDDCTREKNIAKRFFASCEYEELETLQVDPKGFVREFHRIWSIKEAYVKLQGGRIAEELDRCIVDRNRQVILADEKSSACFEEWMEKTSEALPEEVYAAALCTEKPAGDLILDVR